MENKPLIRVNWRTTHMGGLTIPIAFKYGPPLTYVKPIQTTTSHGGTHGQYIYADADIILLLEQTNVTRYRYVTIYHCRNNNKDLCNKLKELAEQVWKLVGNPKLVIYKILEVYGNQTINQR